MNRINRLLSGFVFGLSVFALAAIAAPTCYNVAYQTCVTASECGVTGKSIKVCESAWTQSQPGTYKGTPTSQPRKCYTFTATTQGDCNSTYAGFAKIPNCALSTNGICCFYDTSVPPTESDGSGNIIRIPNPDFCVGTGSPSTPY